VLEADTVGTLVLGDAEVFVGAVETDAAEQPTVPESSATSPTAHTKRPRITDSPNLGA